MEGGPVATRKPNEERGIAHVTTKQITQAREADGGKRVVRPRRAPTIVFKDFVSALNPRTCWISFAIDAACSCALVAAWA